MVSRPPVAASCASKCSTSSTIIIRRLAEIARKGAIARWAKITGRNPEDEMPRALCGGEQPMRIGDVEIPCYVLDDETRVITLSGLQTALGMSPSGGSPRMVAFARMIADNPSMAHDLASRLESPIEFILPNGGIARGYEAIMMVAMSIRQRGEPE